MKTNNKVTKVKKIVRPEDLKKVGEYKAESLENIKCITRSRF